MNAVAEQKTATCNVILSSDMSHYMTLDEMHQRLTTKIREHYSKRG